MLSPKEREFLQDDGTAHSTTDNYYFVIQCRINNKSSTLINDCILLLKHHERLGERFLLENINTILQLKKLLEVI